MIIESIIDQFKNQRRAPVLWLLSATLILFVLIVAKEDMTVFAMLDLEEKEIHAMILTNVQRVQIVL